MKVFYFSNSYHGSQSIKEDFFKNNVDFIDKGVDAAFKQFSNSVFASLNTTFDNFTSDYEKRVILVI